MKTVIAGLEEGLNAIAEALEGGGGSEVVPTPTAQDEGKVLTAGDDGTASWEDASGGSYPEPTSATDGQVLTADGLGGAGWEDAPQGVPDTTGVTNGYVLTNANGTPTWAAASGGGSGTTIYRMTSEVSYNDKDDEYFVSFEPTNATFGDTTEILALYGLPNSTTRQSLSVTHRATIYTMMNQLYVVFSADPGVTNVVIVFATPTAG